MRKRPEADVTADQTLEIAKYLGLKLDVDAKGKLVPRGTVTPALLRLLRQHHDEIVRRLIPPTLFDGIE